MKDEKKCDICNVSPCACEISEADYEYGEQSSTPPATPEPQIGEFWDPEGTVQPSPTGAAEWRDKVDILIDKLAALKNIRIDGGDRVLLADLAMQFADAYASHQSAAELEEAKRPLDKCPKGHAVPDVGCKHCLILGDLIEESRSGLMTLIFEWHDAFYREEGQRNSEMNRRVAAEREVAQLREKEV